VSEDQGREEATARRIRALADERVPAAARDRHLLRIRTHGPVAGGADSAPAAALAAGWRRRLAPLTAAAATIVLFGGGGTVVAAQQAVPDDALYGVKRASEQVWVGLARGEGATADVRLTLAERRLDEAGRASDHAPDLITEGIENVDAAADERPDEAIETFQRLLGDGPDALPEQASPRARQALHRNCVRIAAEHGIDADCGEPPEPGDHPGRGPRRDVGPRPETEPRSEAGRGHGREHAPGQTGERGPKPRSDEHPGRGWGPGGRPPGAVGPPPGAGRREHRGPDADDGDADAGGS
jgi:hypothetical protein